MHCASEVARTCPGECEAAIAQGANCNDDRDCSTLSGTISPVCDFTGTSGNGVCKSGVAAVVAADAACGRISSATSVTFANCGTGLFCDRTGSTDGNGICHALVATGAACERTEACASDQGCFNNVCAAPPIANSVGDACTNNDAGPYCNPFQRLRCGEASTCVAVAGTGVAGDECTTGDFGIECVSSAYCEGDATGSAAHCIARKANGEACGNDRHCTSDHCDFTGGNPGLCAAAVANTCHL
jgi:hypothetical protein